MSVKYEKVKGIKVHQRYYTEAGRQVPGVTTILGVLNKPALVPWANRMGLQGIDTNKYVDKMADIGTCGHYLTECQDLDVEPDLSRYSQEVTEKAGNVLKKYIAWIQLHKVDVIEVEWRLVSNQHLYGGTIDRYCQIDGVPTVLDIKTSKAIWPEHLHQTAAYRQLVLEQGCKVEAVRILQIGRTENEGFSERYLSGDEIDVHWEIFRHCLGIYYARKRLG